MTVHPSPKNLAKEFVRQAWPKRQPRQPKTRRTPIAEVIASVRRAEMTIAQGAREAGCSPEHLQRRVWEETRSDVFARDAGCLICGALYQLDAHHRRARGAGGTADPATAFGMSNLVTLCRTHHSETEANPDWARTKGLRLDAGQVAAEEPVSALNGQFLFSDDGSWRAVGEP